MGKIKSRTLCRACSRSGFILAVIGFVGVGIYVLHHQLPQKLFKHQQYIKSDSAEFHGARIKDIAHQVHHLNDYDRLSPYVPVNKLIYTVHHKDDNGYEADAIKESIMNAIRSGQLLLYNESESCSPCWVENQVEFRKPERATVSEKFPSPYVPGVVPYIPLKPSIFFQGRTPTDIDRLQRKIIVWYTKTRYAKFMDDLEPLRFCPDFPCFMTTNNKFANRSAAMVFAGKLKCPRSDDDKCLENISTRYKFYLGFESSICEDYVSEKFFRYLASDAVVVARASNDIYRHAPSEIYLNTADFSSPKDLADRLLYLDSHDEDYVSMLKEKDKYMVIHEDYIIRNEDGSIRYMTYHYESVPFCEVCYRLWNLDRYKKSIADIGLWFREKMCREPTDLTF
ncbi:hypothetical protein Btru_047127 [Bulinus truncatus]|nr:hypothetical protein Btru_047127 [Bulinus truncatus]